MALTRRGFLKRVAAAGSVSLAYEAMTGLGLLAAPSQAPFNLSGRVSGVRVVILGAGLAGMTVAYELGKVGFDCRLLEARARPGGRVFTVRRGTVSEEDGPSQTAAFDRGAVLQCGADADFASPSDDAELLPRVAGRHRGVRAGLRERIPGARRAARSQGGAFVFERRARISTATSRSS